MRTVILQEIVDQEGIVLGYLYRTLDLEFALPADTAIQLEDGTTVMPVHTVYDVADSTLYYIDIVQTLYLGNMPFREFLSEQLAGEWRFREDIYPDVETMRIKV